LDLLNYIFYSLDNDDEYEVGLQSNDYHSTSNYEKIEQKHEDIQCKAIGKYNSNFYKITMYLLKYNVIFWFQFQN